MEWNRHFDGTEIKIGWNGIRLDSLERKEPDEWVECNRNLKLGRMQLEIGRNGVKNAVTWNQMRRWNGIKLGCGVQPKSGWNGIR